MFKWKNGSKRILVFLLVLGLIGGVMNPLQFTVAASEEEGGEIPENNNDTAEKEAVRPECICQFLCAAKQRETDCPICAENPSLCGGTALEEQSEKNADEEKPSGDQLSDTDTEDEEKPSGDQPSDTDAENKEKPSGDQPSDVDTKDGEKSSGDRPSDVDMKEEAEPAETHPVDSEASAVEALIKNLPSPEELESFDQDKKSVALAQFQEAFEAYESLEEEQKALLAGAEVRLLELLEYFTEPVMPMAATDEQIKQAKTAVTNAMINWEQKVDLDSYGLTEDDWKKIWPDVAQDNPDLFYVLNGTYSISNGTIQNCNFTYNSAYNKDSVAEYQAAINNVFAEVITANMTDEQKATVLHDYLVQHMVYDQNANNNLGVEKRNAYEALVNGIGVCQGYTLAYAALLKKAGIEVDYCKSQSMNHIWNYVKLGDQWYHADLTYDDITAASQTGETGYVKHTYFLLSDTAMQKAGHKWESNNITCNDTTYDNSWQKTAPLTESAIYSVGNSQYYLKKETIENDANICRGAALMQRDGNGNETKVASFEIEGLGQKWPMFSMSFSRLSCSKEILYFNVGNSVYSFKPGTSGTPEKIYTYSDSNNRIVTGLLAKGDEMTLEIYNPQTSQMEEKIQVPLFTLSASESKVEVGYTTAPVLTANPLATGFAWSMKRPGGDWEPINGATGSSYTMEIGLPEGSYDFRVNAVLNGNSVSAEITIMVTDKKDQVNFAFPEREKSVVYGDSDFAVLAQGAETGASVSYSSSDPSVASVDPATGLVRIQKAGSAVIRATASETNDFLEATCTYMLTVSPKVLSWDTSALEAADRLDLITNRQAALYGELKLAGILDRDQGSVRFNCPSDKLSGVYGTVAEGSQTVKLSWRDEQDKALLEGTGTENYTIPSALPEITGKISVIREESVEGTNYKLQVESGISRVPDSFKTISELNTPGKIETRMKLKIQEKYSDIAEANMAVYDVELLINVDGIGWQPVTRDNFPSDGLTITLPYPSGTGRNTHDFVASHMFTAQMNGFYVGDVEYPAVDKTEKGITFKVHGLSPVTIGWTEARDNSSGNGNNNGGSNNSNNNNNSSNNNSNNSNSNNSNNNKSGNGDSGSNNSIGTAADTPQAVSSVLVNTPSTGDRSPVLLYMLLAGAAFGGMLGLYANIKKRKY